MWRLALEYVRLPPSRQASSRRDKTRERGRSTDTHSSPTLKRDDLPFPLFPFSQPRPFQPYLGGDPCAGEKEAIIIIFTTFTETIIAERASTRTLLLLVISLCAFLASISARLGVHTRRPQTDIETDGIWLKSAIRHRFLAPRNIAHSLPFIFLDDLAER